MNGKKKRCCHFENFSVPKMFINIDYSYMNPGNDQTLSNLRQMTLITNYLDSKYSNIFCIFPFWTFMKYFFCFWMILINFGTRFLTKIPSQQIKLS